MLQFGTNEVIVGQGAQRQFMGLNLDTDIKSGQNVWRVVGIFEADGGVAETEIWADARTFRASIAAATRTSPSWCGSTRASRWRRSGTGWASNPQLNVRSHAKATITPTSPGR